MHETLQCPAYLCRECVIYFLLEVFHKCKWKAFLNLLIDLFTSDSASRRIVTEPAKFELESILFKDY